MEEKSSKTLHTEKNSRPKEAELIAGSDKGSPIVLLQASPGWEPWCFHGEEGGWERTLKCIRRGYKTESDASLGEI